MILHPERKDKRTTVVIYTALYIPAFTFIFVNLRAELGNSFVHTFAGIYRINFSLLFLPCQKLSLAHSPMLLLLFLPISMVVALSIILLVLANELCRCSILQKASVISFILKMSANITVIQKGKKQGPP